MKAAPRAMRRTPQRSRAIGGREGRRRFASRSICDAAVAAIAKPWQLDNTSVDSGNCGKFALELESRGKQQIQALSEVPTSG